MKHLWILWALAGMLVQTRLSAQQEEAFKPGGKAEVNIFSDVSLTTVDGSSHYKFDVKRAYLGYQHHFSKSLTGRVTYDIASPSAGKSFYSGFLKYAYLQYHTGKLAVTGGMIPVPEFEEANRKWGSRYIFKPFFDEYGFGTSADLGISVAYAFTPWLSADAILQNGESFKLSEMDSTLQMGLGLKVTPLKELYLRGYADRMKKREVCQQTLGFIAAYETSRFTLSAAYNRRNNQGMRSGYDFSGFTVNGTLNLKDNIRFIARFDQVGSETVTGGSQAWNLSRDGKLFLVGFELSPVKGVKIAPNFQGWDPADSGKPFLSRTSLHMEIKI